MSTPGMAHRHRVAIIGCGAIAYEHLGFLGNSPMIDLVAVCDTSPASADFAKNRFGATSAYTDSAAMLAEVRPDVVHVLTPPHTHQPLVEQSLAAGAHVICEKPAASDLATLEQMIERAQADGLRLMESQNARYNDPVQRALAIRDQGMLGEVREIDVMMAVDFIAGRFGDLNLSGPGVHLPGGAVHDFLPHLAYLFLALAGIPDPDHGPNPDITVAGRLRNASGNARVGFDELDALVFAGPIRGRLRVARDLSPDAFRIVVRGTDASFESDIYNPYERIEGGKNVGKRIALEHALSGARLAWSGVTNLRDKVNRHGAHHGLGRMLEDFYQTLSDGRPQPISFEAMRASARLVDQLVALAEPS